MIIPLLLAIIFAVLGLIHLNWARGGDWGFDAAIPPMKLVKKS